MSAEKQTPKRAVKLLLETFPVHPRSEAQIAGMEQEKVGIPEASLAIALAAKSADRGVRELTSALSE